METKRLVLCDTDVLIHLFRRNPEVEAVINHQGENRFIISCITAAKIYFGMKRKEARKTKELLNRFNLVYVDKPVCQRMINTLFTYTNRLSIADAIIGATVIEYGFDLIYLQSTGFRFSAGYPIF